MSCNCRGKIDSILETKGLRLSDKGTCIRMVEGVATLAHTVSTEYITKGKRGKTPEIFMTHCPFCGKEFHPEVEKPQTEVQA